MPYSSEKGMNETEAKILRLIREYHDSGQPISAAKIMLDLGISSTKVIYDCLAQLEIAGYIEQTRLGIKLKESIPSIDALKHDRKLRVFLCHSSQDKPIVRELYYRLLYEGWIDPWLDEKKLLPGMNWSMEIEIAVEKTDVVIVFLSNNSVTKEGYIQKELKKIIDVADEKLENTIFIIPLRLDDCLVPRQLKNRHFENYFPVEARFDAYRRILLSLKMRAESDGFDMTKISSLTGLDNAGEDDLLKDAINLAIQNGEVTVSLLQRKLRIGYAKSTSLISEMEKMGLLKMTIDQEQPTWLYKPIGSYYAHQ